ncbi:MAG: aldo/keto reductase [Pseudoalteromonas distincta]
MSTTETLETLALGTVQFGLPYGVANRQGQVSREGAGLIVEQARMAGIRTLDTAMAYGTSEEVLGSLGLSGFDIVTKLPALPDDCKDVSGWVSSQLDGSLARLNVSGVNGLMLHRPGQLLEARGPELFQAMETQRDQGRVERIGISIYAPAELDTLCERYHFDLVQAPFNIMDDRLSESGWLDRLCELGTDLHVRSVFMQGLLLMPEGTRPGVFDRWADRWLAWQAWLDDTGLTPLQACLRYALSLPQIERVVVGVDSPAQLTEIIAAAEGQCPSRPDAIGCTDESLLNPSLWKL